MHDTERLVRAFPARLRVEAQSAAIALASRGATLSPDSFDVVVEAERVAVPERLYVNHTGLLKDGGDAVACLLTRHHDGRVRQRALEHVLRLDQAWAVPFILRLAGEYVVEIVERIDAAFSERPPKHLGAFVSVNPDFIRATRARVTSYWDCYHRATPRAEYVGFRLMDLIEAEAETVR